MNQAFKACALATCLGAAWIAFSQSDRDPLDSLALCAATQRLIFENRFVRVIDDRIPVGVAEPLHRHRHGVVVCLSDYTVEQTGRDGVKKESRRKAGTASWSEAVTHEVRNSGTTPSHAIRIELKY